MIKNPSMAGLMARRTRASVESWDNYQRPGGHKSAKASNKANKRRKMEKATKKAQRKKK